LYQIFSGKLENDALTNIQWGESIAYESADKSISYDFSTELVNYLQEDTLPNGETNPLASKFDALTINQDKGTFLASEVATILSELDDDSSDIDAFMSAAAYVIQKHEGEKVSVQKRTQDTTDISTSTSTEYTFEDVADGYYMVCEVSKQSSGLIYSKYMANLGTGSDGTKIFAKDETGPTIVKTLVDGDSDDYQYVAINDTVKFKLTSSVPDMDGYNKYYFVITDTLSAGLEFKEISSVTIGDKTISATDDYNNTGESYMVEPVKNKDGTTTLTITFKNFIQYKELVNSEITIEYSATVDKDIVVGDVNSNTNKAHLTYSNNPNYTYTGDPGSDDPDNPRPEDPDKPNPGDPDDPDNPGEPTITTKDDIVYVYTAGIEVVKVDGNGKRLAGAEFKITDEDTNSNAIIKIVPKYTAECYEGQTLKDGTTAYYKLLSNTYTTDANGTASRYVQTNLKYNEKHELDINGTYYKLKDKEEYVEVENASSTDSYETGRVIYSVDATAEVVNEDDTKSIEGTVSEQNGTIYFEGLNVGKYTITETKQPDGYVILENPIYVTVSMDSVDTSTWVCNWKYTVDNSGNSGNKVEGEKAGTNGIEIIEVENLSTHTLPITGGIGTTIFYVSGSIIAIAAAILLIVKRRMRSEND
jgi:fimbrial isopeptide formation D2 family protein/LPXTG-motif cell wall-anchored protein